ncbi:hypothetical protein [Paraburkholderia sp. SG-MS1]|uniref:hypothetical protein n=1 Tax=Paraburkholderia sp. SG-MS1 TaxID=2023741 RepID=UPI00406C14F1
MRPLASVLAESEINRALGEACGDYPGDRVAAIMAKKFGHPAESAVTARTAVKKSEMHTPIQRCIFARTSYSNLHCFV